MQTPQVKTHGAMGKWMFILAWVCLLGLLVIVFGDVLEKQVNPNQEPLSQITNGQAEVRLKQNRQGHYVTTGTINGQDVVFLVDTGATDVAVPAHLAATLGLTPGVPSYANTANGTVRIFNTRIDHLSIGDIHLQNIKANLNPGMKDDHILLGMSVLRQLEFTQRQDWLILRTFE
jgi:aspartyl protease family protein